MKKHNLKEDFLLEPIDVVDSEIEFSERMAFIYCQCLLLRQIKRILKNKDVLYGVYRVAKKKIKVIETTNGKYVCNLFEAIKESVTLVSRYRRTGSIN